MADAEFDDEPEDFVAVGWPELRELDALLRCGICREVHDAPVALSCGHAFCSQCIRSHLDAQAAKKERGSCPQCRREGTSNDLHELGSLGAVAALYKARVRGPLLQQLAHARRAERARPVPVPRATAAKFAAGVACAQGGVANGQDGARDGGPKRARTQEPPAKRMPNVWYAQYNTMKKLRDLLSRDGLDSSGERSELEARHKAFVSRYNTLVDGQVNLTDGERRSADRLRSEASREVAKGERARAYCAVQQKQASREWWEATAGPSGAANFAIAGRGNDGSFDALAAGAENRLSDEMRARIAAKRSAALRRQAEVKARKEREAAQAHHRGAQPQQQHPQGQGGQRGEELQPRQDQQPEHGTGAVVPMPWRVPTQEALTSCAPAALRPPTPAVVSSGSMDA
eukprot:PRCOL_00002348-RA